jgi:hypothetical protein
MQTTFFFRYVIIPRLRLLVLSFQRILFVVVVWVYHFNFSHWNKTNSAANPSNSIGP